MKAKFALVLLTLALLAGSVGASSGAASPRPPECPPWVGDY